MQTDLREVQDQQVQVTMETDVRDCCTETVATGNSLIQNS